MPAAVSPSKSPTIGQEVNTFAGEVSIVGVRYAFLGSASWFRRLTWMLLVLVGFGFTTYQIQGKVRYLLSYPTVVNVHIQNNRTLRFPTVTLCNENWITWSAAEKLGAIGLMMLMYPPVSLGPHFQPNFTGYDLSSVPDWAEGFKSLSQPKEEAVEQVSLKRLAAKDVCLCKLRCGSYIWQCLWGGEECNVSWFRTVATNLGYCTQFNSKEQSLQITREGTAHGLELVLFANQADYLVAHSLSAGFRVLLHGPDETPLMKEWGFKVSPGFHTLVSVSVSKSVGLEPPWGECSNEEGYTYTECKARCMADHVIKNCSCREFYMPGDADVCNPKEMHECAGPSMSTYINKDLQSKCACPQPCEKTMYGYSASAAVASQYALGFVTMIGAGGATVDDTKNDYGILTIFFSELSYEEIITSEAYDLLSLFCDIGGALGLMLGSTLLTVCEIGDFCITKAWARIWSNGQQSTEPKVDESNASI